VSDRARISDPYDEEAIFNIEAVQANITTFNVSADAAPLFTSRYATLQIWGSLANSSTNATNMFGDGATVAEFSVIVEGLDQALNGPGKKMRRSSAGAAGGEMLAERQLRDVDLEFLRKLGRIRGRNVGV